MAPPLFGFCKLCEKQLSENTTVCPHCGCENPIDRYEDVKLGQIYAAEYVGAIVEDLYWFRLTHSGRRVFAAIPSEGAAGRAFSEARERHGAHRLECFSFEDRYPRFRYLVEP